MGLFSRLATKSTSIADYTWSELFPHTNAKSGVAVNVDTALRVTTVLACVRVLSEGVAQLSRELFDVDETSGSKTRVRGQLDMVLSRRPNEWMTSYEMFEVMTAHAVITGNAYAYIGWGGGKVQELIPLVPSRVTVMRHPDYSLTYYVSGLDGSQTTLAQENVLHLKGPSWNGYLGMDSVQLAREAIGLAITTEETHASLHANGAQPGGVLAVKGKLDKEARERLKTAWQAFQGGVANRFKTAVLDVDATWSPLAMTGVDSQHLETRRFQIEEICRAMRVFPQLVMHTDKTSTFASADAFFLAHVTHSLMPWITRWEQAIQHKLLADSPTTICKFNTAVLLRGDIAARGDFYMKALGGARGETAYMTRNEVRALEDMNPIDGGDKLLIPVPTPLPTQGPAPTKSFFLTENKFNPNHDDRGRFAGADGGGEGGTISFVSPNVSNTSFHQAVTAIGEYRQQALSSASAAIDAGLGLAAQTHNAVGAWSDGAESTLMTASKGGFEAAKIAAAMKGYLADQKAVLVFEPQAGGHHFMASFKATGTLNDIHSGLLQDGVAFHTLVPTAHGAQVYVFGQNQADLGSVQASAGTRFNAKLQVATGRGEFIGTTLDTGTDRQQRDDARRVYSEVIANSGASGLRGRNVASLWNSIQHNWGAALKGLEAALVELKYNENHDELGRFAFSDGSSDSGGGVGVHAHGIKPAKAVKQVWIDTSPIKTRDDVFAGAPANKITMDNVGAQIAASIPGVGFKAAGNKKNGDRVTEKLLTRSPAGLTDIVRSTFIVNSPAQADAVVAALGKHFPTVDEGFGITDVGYVDRSANVHFKNGQIGEFLILSPEMSWAKSPDGGGGHKIYDATRSLPKNSPEFIRGQNAQLKLYGEAIRKQPAVWGQMIPAIRKFSSALFEMH
jgi:HK97 family phage portal protein